MLLRLWAIWEPADHGRPSALHLEVERPYGRVPMAGESIDLPKTGFGLAQPVVESVNWDEEAPNLVLGGWKEVEGARRAELTEAGFHGIGERLANCRYCAMHGRARRLGGA